MNEYILNQYQDNYAEGSGRNILEIARGRTLLKKIEFGYEAILESRTEEEFSDE